MSEAVIESEKIISKGLLKKGLEALVYVIVSSIIMGCIMLIPFYWRTSDSLPVIQDDIKQVKEEIVKIKSSSEGPMIDGKLNSQRLDDIQRQVNSINDDVKELKAGQQKTYDLIFQINQNTKK